MSVAAKSAKITSSHRTLTETADEVVKVADGLDYITKICLGAIRHVPGGRRGIKFKPIIGGIIASIRGNGAVQDVYFYTEQPELAQSKLSEKF